MKSGANSAAVAANSIAAAAVPRASLLGLYKRLRIAGETPQMLRRTAVVHDLPTVIQKGRALLSIHRDLAQIDAARGRLRMWHLRAKLLLAVRRRFLLARLLKTRVQLVSFVAIVNLLTSSFLLLVAFLVYQMYRACRVGVSKAEEKYQTLSIPVLQTIDALAAAEERRKLQMRAQMENDVRKTR